MTNNNIDLLVFLALVVDLTIRYFKMKKVKNNMPGYKRYQYNTTMLRTVLYVIILAFSLGYLGFRLYCFISGNVWSYPTICIFIPLIDYYVIWDYFFNGIYYNKHGIYFKSEYYEFRRAVHIYRDLIKDRYEFDITYRTPEGTIRNFIMKVPNEKEAFELLAHIPFEEE